MVAYKKKIQTYKQKQYKNTIITHYVQSQSITIFTKCIIYLSIYLTFFNLPRPATATAATTTTTTTTATA